MPPALRHSPIDFLSSSYVMVLIMSEPVSQIAALYFMGAPLLPRSSSSSPCFRALLLLLLFFFFSLLPRSSSFSCFRTHDSALQDLRRNRRMKTANTTLVLILSPRRNFNFLLFNFSIRIKNIASKLLHPLSLFYMRLSCFKSSLMTRVISIRRAASNSRMQQQHQEVPDTLRPLRRTIAPVPALPTPTTVRMPGPADAGGSGGRGGGDGNCCRI
jgi:hypothetical protein